MSANQNKWSIRTMVLAGFSLALLAVGIMGYFAYDNARELSSSLKSGIAPENFLHELNELRTKVIRAESSVKSFAINSDPDLLMTKYFVLIKNAYASLDSLDKMARGKGAELSRLRNIRSDIGETINIHANLVRLVGDNTVSAQFDRMVRAFIRLVDQSRDSMTMELKQTDSLAISVVVYGLNRDTLIKRLTTKADSLQNSIFFYIDRLEYTERVARIKVAEIGTSLTEETRKFVAIFGFSVLVVCSIFVGIIFHDLQQNRRLQQRLTEEKRRAEKLARAKQEFLANMSHEIRTPMNAVIGFAEQLSTTQLSFHQQGLLQPIRESADYLLALINDILDYSKLDSGNVNLDETGFRPQVILDEVSNIFSRSAKEKGIELICEATSELPEVLIGDPLRLKQMLFNLVNNAIKFTHEGEVRLSAEGIVRPDKREVQMVFSVIDTGIGIPASQIERIFSEFIQGDSSTTRKYGGTGLGLSITRKLARIHGGDVEIESKEEEGSTFRLKLFYPLGTEKDLPVQQPPVYIQPHNVKGIHILVADDEPYNRMLIRTIMEKWGIINEIVENGKEVIEKLKKGTYDCILMDLQMPEMDGMTATQIIRQEMGLDIPIIALTATSTPTEIRETSRIGMNGYLLKPFQEQELMKLILQSLGRDISANMSNDKKANQAFHFDTLYKLANQDMIFMRNMLDLFVNTTSENLAEMRKALANESWDKLSNLAHKIIPPCRHLGLHSIVKQLKSIELEARNVEIQPFMAKRVELVSDEIQSVIDEIRGELEKLDE